jgi:hypothetical protein
MHREIESGRRHETTSQTHAQRHFSNSEKEFWGPRKASFGEGHGGRRSCRHKKQELGRQRLAAAIETGKHKKTLFER